MPLATSPVFCHLEHPADRSVVSPGVIALRGWAAGTEALPLTDLRIRLDDGSSHPVAYGFLREDLARHFRWRQKHLPGGFEARIPLRPGAQTLRFEGCDLSGHWQSLGTVTLSAEGPSPLTPAAATPPELLAEEFARIVDRYLRAAPAIARDTGSAFTDIPIEPVTRYAPRPFQGHLNHPLRLAHTTFGRLPIAGWLLHESQAIQRVVATVDLQAWQSLEYGLPLPPDLDPSALGLPARPGGFSGFIDIPSQLSSPLSVRVYAQLADDTWHLCQIQRTAVVTLEERKTPLPVLSSADFVRTVLALRHAARRRGFRLPPPAALASALRPLHAELHAAAASRSAAAEHTSAVISAAPASPVRHVTLISHNLSYEGAPLFLLEYARHLAAQGVAIRLIAASDGPLRLEYARLGVTPELIDDTIFQRTHDPAAWSQALQRAIALPELRQTELIVANTLSTYWAVHLASHVRRPSLLYIHESTTPARFYQHLLAPEIVTRVEAALSLATHVSFLTEATRRYYRPWLGGSNHSITPGWIDLAAIDRFRQSNPRDLLRRRLGLSYDTKLVVNLGSVCERKGQHIFARAVDLVARRHPELAAGTRFLMVGARDTPFDAVIVELLGTLDRPNLDRVPQTDSPLAFLGAADLFVCTSYEESFPRVVLEAMACEVPILSTDVHGIPEILGPFQHDPLISPGDTHALADQLIAQLLTPNLTAVARARSRVAQHYTAQLLLPRHQALACKLAAPPR